MAIIRSIGLSRHTSIDAASVDQYAFQDSWTAAPGRSLSPEARIAGGPSR